MRRKMYKELGGYLGYRKTPLRELQEVRLSIIAELNHQAEEDEKMREEQEAREAESKRLLREANQGRH